jgi:hypothetical protein
MSNWKKRKRSQLPPTKKKSTLPILKLKTSALKNLKKLLKNQKLKVALMKTCEK